MANHDLTTPRALVAGQETMPADYPEWECPFGLDHDWELVTDWEGDPGVINGTRTFQYRRCRQCGEES